MADLNDNELVLEFAREKSEAAFAALVRQHINLVFATALRQVGDRNAAEEITQTVFVALAQSAGKLGSHPTIAGWLHRTALNKSREWLRGELRRRKREQTAIELAEANAEGDSVWASLVPLLDEALLQLRDADRAAVILHFMEGRTFQEVGSVLGVGEDTVRKRVDRCLEQLTKFFQRQGFTVPALSATTPLFALASHTAPTELAASATSASLAAHSTSTLTVKGALKIMAWTKVKTATVAGVVILLAAGTTTVFVKHASSARRQATFEEIFQHPDGSSVPRLDKAPPTLIVRPTRYPNGNSGAWTVNGKGVYVGATISDVLCWAYGTLPTRMIIPENISQKKYDYLDTLPNNHQEMLRAEIQKQFGLVATKETRPTDVLLLKVANATLLESHSSRGGNSRRYVLGENRTQTFYCENQKLSDVADGLEGYFNKPIINQTGTASRYTFQLQWPNSMFRTKALAMTISNQLNQLGLELVPTNMPVEMLVVEKAK